MTPPHFRLSTAATDLRKAAIAYTNAYPGAPRAAALDLLTMCARRYAVAFDAYIAHLRGVPPPDEGLPPLDP